MLQGEPNFCITNMVIGTFTTSLAATGIAEHVGKGMGVCSHRRIQCCWLDGYLSRTTRKESSIRIVGGKKLRGSRGSPSGLHGSRGSVSSHGGVIFVTGIMMASLGIFVNRLGRETFHCSNGAPGSFSCGSITRQGWIPSLKMAAGHGIYELRNDGFQGILFTANSHRQ